MPNKNGVSGFSGRGKRIGYSVTVAILLCVLPARAAEMDDLRQIARIAASAGRANTDALKQLEALQAGLPAATSYTVRRALSRALMESLYDAGRFHDLYRLCTSLQQMAEVAGDKDTVLLTRIATTYQLLDQNQPDQMVSRLGELRNNVAASSDREVQIAWRTALTRAYNLRGDFDLALTHALAILQLPEQPGTVSHIVRLNTMAIIARMYSNMRNPEKALATADAALATDTGNVSQKTLATLIFMRGLALKSMKRGKESLVALKKALELAREAGLGALEANILGNIADLHLTQHNYVEAERVARLGLAKSEAINEKNYILMGKANIGFALGGQGKIAQSLPYIDAVIDSMKQSKSIVGWERMLEEKGHMLETAGLYREALATVRQQQAVQKDVFLSERVKSVAALQEQFDATQRTRQIKLLARENDLKDAALHNGRLKQLVTTLGAALTVLAGGLFGLLYKRAKRSNQRLNVLNSQLEFHATHDPMTGMYNRRSFIEKMKARSQAAGAERRVMPVKTDEYLVLMDIDHFKHINDTWGHAAGDAVLVEVARRLTTAVRDADMVLRWGGEEFVVHASAAHFDHVVIMVERILAAIGEQPVQLGDLSIPVTMTAGFVGLTCPGLVEEQFDWEKALQLADMALYHGKKHGRNQAHGVEGVGKR